MELGYGREILEQLPEMGTDTRPMQHGPYSRAFKSKSGRKGERKIAGKRKDSFIYDLVVLLSSFYLWFGAASARQKMRHHRIYTERHNGLYYGVQSHCISFYNWNHTLLCTEYNIHIISIISPLSWLTCLYLLLSPWTEYTECIPSLPSPSIWHLPCIRSDPVGLLQMRLSQGFSESIVHDRSNASGSDGSACWESEASACRTSLSQY